VFPSLGTLPNQTTAQVAVYSDHWMPVAAIRRILLRMKSWMNYVLTCFEGSLSLRKADVWKWPILLQKSAGSTFSAGLGSGNSSSQSLAVCPAWVAATLER